MRISDNAKALRSLAASVAAIALCASLAVGAQAASNGTAGDGADDAPAHSEFSLLAAHEANGISIDPDAELVKETCLPCHSDYVEATADYNYYYNPHDEREGVHFSDLKCSRCHSLTEDPVNFCTTCHNGLVLGEGWRSMPLSSI